MARFDYAVMLVIIADTVFKPTLSDVSVLAAMAVLIAAGAWAAFGNQRQVVTSAA